VTIEPIEPHPPDRDGRHDDERPVESRPSAPPSAPPRSIRWTVGAGDAGSVGALLLRAGADERAVAEGRVFVGRRRVRSGDEAVVEGDVMEVSAPPSRGPVGPTVILQTNDLVAAAKPAGVPTIPDHAGSAHALVALVARELGLDPARLHPTSRLDREVSGVVFLALTSAAAERLLRARATGSYERRYLAVASRSPEPVAGRWDAPIGRARDPRLRAAKGPGALASTTRYAACAFSPRGEAMLAVAPLTGRTHQIRVHAAHAGLPLLGDRSYGGPARLTLANGRVVELRRIALHAARVSVPDGNGGRIVATAPVPRDLSDLWAALGGDASAWDLCAECPIV
jgi:23S rRNA-/tRNA-specific pseudouridylate synthase